MFNPKTVVVAACAFLVIAAPPIAHAAAPDQYGIVSDPFSGTVRFVTIKPDGTQVPGIHVDRDHVDGSDSPR